MVFSNVSHNIITIRHHIITIHCISYNTAQYATRTAGKQMNKFWDSNMTDPWDCWSICDFDLPLCTPSNQVQESWHNQILKAKSLVCSRVALSRWSRWRCHSLYAWMATSCPLFCHFMWVVPPILAQLLVIEGGGHKSSLCVGTRGAKGGAWEGALVCAAPPVPHPNC